VTYRAIMLRALLLCVLLPSLFLTGRPARADHFSSVPMSDGGREHGVVASHGMDLFDITSPAGGYSPARRAEIIAGRLEELTQSHDEAPEMFSVGHRNGEVILQQQEHAGHPPHIIVTVSRRLTSDGNVERLAQWWLALLRDHLALADGGRPIYTAGTPVGDVFQGLYERLGNHVKPVSSADIERAFDALPPLQRQAFRQAAATVPDAYSPDRLAPGGAPPQDSAAVSPDGGGQEIGSQSGQEANGQNGQATSPGAGAALDPAAEGGAVSAVPATDVPLPAARLKDSRVRVSGVYKLTLSTDPSLLPVGRPAEVQVRLVDTSAGERPVPDAVLRAWLVASGQNPGIPVIAVFDPKSGFYTFQVTIDSGGPHALMFGVMTQDAVMFRGKFSFTAGTAPPEE